MVLQRLGGKLFTNCSGPCVACVCTGRCQVEEGSDDFEVASEGALRLRLKTKRWGGLREGRELGIHELRQLRGYLWTRYGVETTDE